jgi:hypothetical protein
MSVKTATGFSPFQLVYGMEAVLPIECQIPSLKLAVELFPDTSPLEERLLYLEQLDEKCVMQPWLMRLTRNESSVNMIGCSSSDFL